MKRVVYLAVVLLTALPPFSLLVGCSADITPRQLVGELCSACGVEGAEYGSFAREGEEGYIGQRLEMALFDAEMPDGVEYALVLHSRLDGVSEIGAFRCPGTEERLYVKELVENRVLLLESTARSGEGMVAVRGELVIYAYLSDVSELPELIDRMLG